MIEFPVDVIGIIKSMTLRSIGNPNALKYTINNLLYAYKDIILMILSIVIIIFLVKFVYKMVKKILENKKNKEKILTKKDLKEIFLKEKLIFRVLKYPIIGSILVGTCWAQVSLLFRLFGEYNRTQGDIIRESLPLQESWLLGLWATYSLCIFIIAGCFIGLSFGNKMLRNIGILIYVLGILFILFGCFLDYGIVVNDLPNFTV